jgi:hypothetical protein
MIAEFIPPDDSRWKIFLSGVKHDSYHLPEYISLAARQEGGQACAFFAETGGNSLLVPLLMRPIPEELNPEPGSCDVLTPYGYPGPLLAGNPSEDTVKSMLRSFVRAGRKKGVVSAFWRLHPLLPFPLAPLGEFGRLVQHGRTVYIDLSLTPEQMWQETSNNHRRHIRQMQKNGFVVVRNEWRYLDAFIKAYRESMSRLEASQFYFFSDDYFEDLRKALGDRLDLWTVLSPEGEVAAAGLFTVVNGMVEYHLGANAQEFVLWSPLKLLISEVRFWAREAGHRLLHLGGGVGGDMDSLYTFKSRFSPLSAEFFTFRAVLMPEAYDQLTRKKLGMNGKPDVEGRDFFPAYRNL